MNDPLWHMSPGDEDWDGTLAEEAEALASALWSDNDERFIRKARELHNALGRHLAYLNQPDDAPPPAPPANPHGTCIDVRTKHGDGPAWICGDQCPTS